MEKIFQHGAFAASVQWPVLHILKKDNFQTMSGDGKHTEGAVIKAANVELEVIPNHYYALMFQTKN